MTTAPIILSADDRYAQHLAVTIISILTNCQHPTTLRFFILDGGIADDNKEKIQHMVANYQSEVTFITSIKQTYTEFPVNSERMSIAAYFRISIPELFDDNITQALYLDCDLVVEDDILNLLHRKVAKDKAVGAVEDISRTIAYQRLQIPPHHYFNSGVLLLNLSYWRNHNISAKIREFKLQNAHRMTTNDQCAFNGILWSDWERLPLRWNQQSGIYRKRLRRQGATGYSPQEHWDAIKNPAIIHYVGHRKPWNPGCLHPLQHRYWKYLAMTPWAADSSPRRFSLHNIKSFFRKPHRHITAYFYRKISAIPDVK